MRPHPRYAETDPTAPRAWATCDKCGLIWNHYKLGWQYDWRGQQIQNTWILTCPNCLDEPQRQLGTIVLPPDPLPVMEARVEPYFVDEWCGIMFELDTPQFITPNGFGGQVNTDEIHTEDGNTIVLEFNQYNDIP